MRKPGGRGKFILPRSGLARFDWEWTCECDCESSSSSESEALVWDEQDRRRRRLAAWACDWDWDCDWDGPWDGACKGARWVRRTGDGGGEAMGSAVGTNRDERDKRGCEGTGANECSLLATPTEGSECALPFELRAGRDDSFLRSGTAAVGRTDGVLGDDGDAGPAEPDGE
jgi:hypothetical protein